MAACTLQMGCSHESGCDFSGENARRAVNEYRTVKEKLKMKMQLPTQPQTSARWGFVSLEPPKFFRVFTLVCFDGDDFTPS